MPQSSPQQRAEWGIDATPVIQFLKSAGYRLTRGWTWIKPTQYHVPTEKEVSAICFLIDEWDFGGVV